MKKPAIALVVLFLGFYLLRDPAEMASVTKTAGAAGWDALTTLFEALIDFLGALVG
jgi:hypothetical protein